MTTKAKTPNRNSEDRLTGLNHSDELNRMEARLKGLIVAFSGAMECEDNDKEWGSVWQLVEDISDRMERCRAAFEAERQLRIAEER